jgi:ParB family chromosome partitioning protein
MSSPKKRNLDFGALAARQVSRDAATASAGPDRFERAKAALAGPPSLLEIDDIIARQESTRETDAGHVKALAESIGALGLIEPIVVDSARRLLAGGHRVDAIKLLREEQPEAFAKWFAAGVPVRTMDFDAESSPSRALEVEIAENEHRRDYTGAQVKELASRLRAAGYRDSVGRPKAGEKALGPALEVILGKSMKTIRKILVEQVEGAAEAPSAAPERPLVKVRRTLEKQRPLLPEALLCHLDALLQGLEAELEQQGA